MNKKIIESIFDRVINDFTIKCGRVSTRESVGNAFKRVSEKYGLSLKKYTVDREDSKKYDNDRVHYDIVYSLYDKGHNTKINFTEKFLDDNTIAFNPRGNHKNHNISLDEIIEGYIRLPDNNKKHVNQIIFKNWGTVDDKDKDIIGYSKFEDSSAKDMNTISILSQYFKNKNPTGDGWDNYDFVLAHESTHCLDFREVSEEEYNVRMKYLNMKNYPNDIDTILKEHNNLKKIETTKSGLSQGYPYYRNQDYLKEVGFKIDDAVQLKKASDYGTVSDTEDFADTGAMIINGYYTPDNPKAIVRWNGGTMQYREWIKLHPYTGQYLVKLIYDEDVSIDTLLSQGIDTERNSPKGL